MILEAVREPVSFLSVCSSLLVCPGGVVWAYTGVLQWLVCCVLLTPHGTCLQQLIASGKKLLICTHPHTHRCTHACTPCHYYCTSTIRNPSAELHAFQMRFVQQTLIAGTASIDWRRSKNNNNNNNNHPHISPPPARSSMLHNCFPLDWRAATKWITSSATLPVPLAVGYNLVNATSCILTSSKFCNGQNGTVYLLIIVWCKFNWTNPKIVSI